MAIRLKHSLTTVGQTFLSAAFLPALCVLLISVGAARAQIDDATRTARLKRSPIEVAKVLSKHYGHDLRSVAYIPSLALVGRVWLGEITQDASHLDDVVQIVEPYVNGEKAALSSGTRGVNLAGHLIFGELALKHPQGRANDYTMLVRAAADRAFDDKGDPLEAVPGHSEMSDSVFMVCPILARAGKLTGDTKYDDMCVRHLNFMRTLCAREDGLYRHSPLDEAAWGRGNGFPALGLALALTDLPADAPPFVAVLKDFREHMAALIKHQDTDGMWHQVIDHPDSYQEMSATCMITFAIVRGLREGWLPRDTYEPVVRKAWRAINQRIDDDGSIHGVCVGTGKQKNLDAYFKRPANFGKDARGGAMALMVTTELARWEAENN